MTSHATTGFDNSSLTGTEMITINDTVSSITTPTVTGFQTWLDASYVHTAGETQTPNG